ncbi:MAG TPA: alpha/beta fold hydrolase [Candidatus Acidoferrales bacterium]|nr:alpha/beta fold hydrolase [Candidatus Acidoferrales bacterium]
MAAELELLTVEAARNRVAVLRYEPIRRPRGVALVAGHGYSSSKHNLDPLCGFLASHGFTVYNLDFPGHKLGASGGALRGVDDCIDAMSSTVRLARERGATTYTLGHSMGGMTALFTAALDESIAGAIAIATGYGRPDSLRALKSAGATDFRSAYVAGVTLPELVEGIDRRYDALLPRLQGRECAYVAADRDAMVSPASVRALFDRAPERKWFATIASDHTYAAEHARAAVLQWLDERHPRP